MATATFRFYAELNDFLPPERRARAFPHTFAPGTSVKHAIEAIGVPHPEVDLILVNGEPADFGRRLADGDRASVFPFFGSIDVAAATKVRAAPTGEVRFVLDCHLGRLAKYLRILGFDTVYGNSRGDEALAAIAAGEQRVLLTMDKGLLMRGNVERGYYVREPQPERQLLEVLRRFRLFGAARPLERCLRCNTRLAAVSREAVLDRIPPRVRERCEDYSGCPSCGRIYWRGSHYDRMQHFIESVYRRSYRPM